MQEIAECKSVHIVCVPEVFAVADYIFVHRILVKTGERERGVKVKSPYFLLGAPNTWKGNVVPRPTLTRVASNGQSDAYRRMD